MSKSQVITVKCFGEEVGRLALSEDSGFASFQYHADFLTKTRYTNLFPLVIKRTSLTQTFRKFNSETFRGLPPMFADSLPDLFGNLIFRTWLESGNKNFSSISALEQLTYIGNRGMGAIEYAPATEIKAGQNFDLGEIVEVVNQILNQKNELNQFSFDHDALMNIFKMGTSAGGVGPKLLISEHKTTGQIVPGDTAIGDEWNYYLVKLNVDSDRSYNPELVEYSYALAAKEASIGMMDCKMISDRHFATHRFDRIDGRKKHVLTASGISGLDFKDAEVSSYENLFDLMVYLKCPHQDSEELFRRLVFNLVFANHDDHLKNHSFIYDEHEDRWHLAPAYDLTYSLNPDVHVTRRSRALSINGKRTNITLTDIQEIAERYTIRKYRDVLLKVHAAAEGWTRIATELGVPVKTQNAMRKHFQFFAG